MEWQPGGLSSDIEDRRSDSGGGGGGFGFGGGGLGIGGFILLLVISLVTGHNFLGGLFGGGNGGSQTQTQQVPQGEPSDTQNAEGNAGQTAGAGNDRDAQLISFVNGDVQKFWRQTLTAEGKPYHEAHIVLYRGETDAGCGEAQAATGPFYCPEDQKVYIDLSFWDELRKFGGSTADFAQAFVLSHELGHHVQNMLGIEPKVQHLMETEPSERNHLSVDLELQADCFGGVWAHHAQAEHIVDPGDIPAALSAVAAVGDDHLEKMSGRAVSPESWTHGSSQQRQSWFERGFQSGDPANCNTFGGSSGQ